ncbi:hypothetical protein X797_003539 [Metarhizium robertsii]|uniref:Uncharacterized protein n=1 Tax=Metarhizium robertsii TaxID=568076 RepID=A0A0A1V1K6_9HYPO|nr:hypothetical protein X797_003539 [Metarhizium robertsii]
MKGQGEKQMTIFENLFSSADGYGIIHGTIAKEVYQKLCVDITNSSRSVSMVWKRPESSCGEVGNKTRMDCIVSTDSYAPRS